MWNQPAAVVVVLRAFVGFEVLSSSSVKPFGSHEDVENNKIQIVWVGRAVLPLLCTCIAVP